MTAIASAKTSATIMAISIFGADEGFRPNDMIDAKPIAPMTMEGPSMVTNITSKIMILRMDLSITFFS